jgi:hypothetical protein
MNNDPKQPASSTPLSAAAALDAYFLEARSKLLDLAGILDRIDRGASTGQNGAEDVRLSRVRKALEILQTKAVAGRAERVQHIVSLEYDATWERPTPR